MNQKIIKDEEGYEYFACPRCNKVIIMSWDSNNHHVLYPDECSECNQQLSWNKRLTDINCIWTSMDFNKHNKNN